MLTPDSIQDLVTIAFCLEPLAEKPGCTTRTHDLPGKPLTDFMIAGINAGKYFRAFAHEVQEQKTREIFSQFVPALKTANTYKTPKTINFGLLEIMFPAVYARMHCAHRDGVVEAMITAMHNYSPEDVRHLLDARAIAWETSTSAHKKQFNPEQYMAAQSPWEFYKLLHAMHTPDQSSYQWAQEYFDGLPIIRQVLASLEKRQGSILEITASVHTTIIAEKPAIKVGMVADMCAAGIFLHLSYL